ncbi:MAG TPA: peptide-methionine (S)-S-oxide reductase MsrA [Paraburkholderia sp.]|nr:peptide-methionine (S)-S-oxide reductase MsrA [Paraburkholderia sp.]
MIEIEQATFGAGCFWGAEAAFRALPGVVDTRVGFAAQAGGEGVQIEVVQVDFSPSQLSFSALIERFWELHDPTSVDRQGQYSGAKYRSAIFITSDQQEGAARAAISQADASHRFTRPIATVVLPLGQFELASEDDQRYLEKHGSSACSLGA